MKDSRILMPDGQPITPESAAAVIAVIHDAVFPDEPIIPASSLGRSKLAELYAQIKAMSVDEQSRLRKECLRIIEAEFTRTRRTP